MTLKIPSRNLLRFLCCLVLSLTGAFGSLGCSSSPNRASAASAVSDSVYTELISEWGLDALSEVLAAESSPQALTLLHAIGAPVDEGLQGLRDWAEADEILLNTQAEPTMPATLAEAPAAQQMNGWLQAAVAEGLCTGYNIVPSSLWPEYDPSRTIIYGHSNIRHARQLLLLLRIEGLSPRFQFVPKMSAFRYRDGWGGSTEHLLELSDGGKLVIAEEYDLFLVFDQPGERERFAELVTAYAKKDAPDEPGLIYQSWWQPFYRAFDPVDSMSEVRLIQVSYAGYRSNIISLLEQAPNKRAKLAERFPEMHFEIVPIWVNPSFYRYIGGAYR